MIKREITATTFAEMLDRAVSEPGIVSAAYTAFHGYSIGNQLLAMMQCGLRSIPAGPIATFNGWREKGRYVRKGERAIVLCMPVTCKRKGEASAAAESADGAESGVTYTRFVHRPNWFVLAQTDGAEYVPIAIDDWSEARALPALKIDRVAFEHTDGNVQGYARERSIAVSPIAEYPHKTLFHELAHILLGHTAEADTLSDNELTPRSLREVEAEAVAMICGEALALPGAAESRGYIQHWNARRGAEPIPERSAQRIFKAADQILRAGRPAAGKDAE